MNGNIIKAKVSEGLISATRVKKEVYDTSLEAQKVLKGARSEAEKTLESARSEAQKILEGARSEAERITSEAKSESQKLTEDAGKQGYEAGLARWNDTLVEACKRRDEYLDRSEAELIRIAIAASRKIIGEEVRANPKTIENTVREVRRSMGRQKGLTIQVNPAQEAIVNAQAQSLRTLFGGSCNLTVLGNASIEEGGCIVESDIGVIDAQIATQLAALEQALLRKVDQ